MRSTADGGYALLSRFDVIGLSHQLCLIRTDAGGDTLWTRNYGGDMEEDEGIVLPTADGGFLLCAHERTFAGSSSDAYLVKTDALGRSSCFEEDTIIEQHTAAFDVETVSLLTLPLILSMVDENPTVSSGAQIYTWCEASTGLHVLPAAVGLSVFPVPCANSLQLDGTQAGGTLTLMNATGKLLRTFASADGSTRYPVADLPPGSYLLRYEYADGISVLHIVKE